MCENWNGGVESESTFCVITTDKLKIFDSRYKTLLEEYEIDLEVKDYIGININVDLTDHANIYIYSNGSDIVILLSKITQK